MDTSPTQPERSHLTFRGLSSIVLGAIAGVLIAMPIVALGGVPGTLVLVTFGGMGGLAGYKRRESVGFFYFALVCVLVLSSVMVSNLLVAP